MPRPHAEEPGAAAATPIDIAIRLLELQQRVAAFGSLYDEEITRLTDDLSRLKADFVRHYQDLSGGGAPAAKATRPSRGAGPSTSRRKAPKRQPNGSSAQKE